MSFRATLAAAADASGRVLDDRILDACAEHFALLVKWNQAHNLTRITEPDEAARKHYLVCLVPLLDLRAGAAPWAAGWTPASFVDVGSGAGFPGLFAALVWPEATATLVEPARKRASFLTLAARAMGVRVAVQDPPPGAQELHGVAAPIAAAEGSGAVRAVPPPTAVVLSRATFAPGARRGLLASAGDAVAVWGRPEDVPTWNAEVATWPGWMSMWQRYEVAGLETRALLWGVPGGFHVEHPGSAP